MSFEGLGFMSRAISPATAFLDVYAFGGTLELWPVIRPFLKAGLWVLRMPVSDIEVASAASP